MLSLPQVKNSTRTFSHSRTVVCYRLVKGNSNNQPFILEPIGAPDEIKGTGFYRPCGANWDAEGDREGSKVCNKLRLQKLIPGVAPEDHWSPCSALESERDPILADQILVIGIDLSDVGAIGINMDQLKLLNFNVTNQQGTALNPTPLRATFPSTTSPGGGGGPVGSKGRAGEGGPDEAQDDWEYVGTNPPNGTYPRPWSPYHPYFDGDLISDAAGANYYIFKNRHKGKRITETVVGKRSVLYTSGPAPTDPFSPFPVPDWIFDGAVVWQEMDAPTRMDKETGMYWEQEHEYQKGEFVCVARRNHYFDYYDLDPSPAEVELLQYSKADQLKYHDALGQALKSHGSQITLMHKEDDLRETDCSIVEQNIADSMAQDPDPDKLNYHLQYYLAVKGGTSGPPPSDPLSVSYVPRAIYLEWPDQLSGDVVPTFNVNLIYSPPTPGAMWQPNTFYPAGSVVTPRVGNGHYYTALHGGMSAIAPNEPEFPHDSPANVADGTLLWLDSGTTAPNVPSAVGTGGPQASGGSGQGGGQASAGEPQGGSSSSAAKPQLWFPNTRYLLGDVISNSANGHYYTVVGASQGYSGSQPTGSGASAASPKDPFPRVTPPVQTLADKEVQWLLTSDHSHCDPWAPNLDYSIEQCVQLENGSYYRMAASTAISRKSGFDSPFKSTSTPPTPDTIDENGITWKYAPTGSATQAWLPKTPYSKGESIADPHNLRNVYVAQKITIGSSGSIDPTRSNSFGQPATVADGDLLWADLGPQQGHSRNARWKSNHPYPIGFIVNGFNDHDYQVIRFTAGVSGTKEQVFQIAPAKTIVDVNVESKVTEQQTGLEWLDLGDVPPQNDPPEKPEEWVSNHRYSKGEVIFVLGVGNGRYYRALNTAKSGNYSPFQNVNTPDSVTWVDSGTTQPASLAGGTPADQTVSLINLTLPQAHSLSYFNISAGVVVDFKKPLAFGFVPALSFPGAPGTLPAGYTPGAFPPATGTVFAVDPITGCTISAKLISTTGTTTQPASVWECPTLTGAGAMSVDPVLVLTGYLVPVDAERPVRFWGRGWWRDYLPAPGLGISLSNPTTNFYLGASSEALVRNLQFFYGVGFHDSPVSLAPGSSQPIWSGVGTPPAVATKSGFQKGAFFGATFNLSGFVQTLFGGGGKGQ
jgi:hypothetical protein